MTPGPSLTSTFWRGARAGFPFVVVAGPFAMLFGVLASEAGFDIVTTLAMSVFVIAGAAQFTALQMLADQAPTLIIVLSSLAVNLRLAMYSAAIAPHLGAASFRTRAFAAYLLTDQSFAAAIAEYERRKMTLGQKYAYFFGASLPIVPFWYGGTVVGALFGAQVPADWGLDFAMPITFLALIAPMVRTLAHLAAVAVSIACALGLAWVPYNGGVLIAATLAMLAGAEVERRRGRAG